MGICACQAAKGVCHQSRLFVHPVSYRHKQPILFKWLLQAPGNPTADPILQLAMHSSACTLVPFPPFPSQSIQRDPLNPSFTHEDLAGVAILQRQAGVRDQVGQAVLAAQQTSLRVVGEAVLGALNGRRQRQSGGRALLVLRAGGVGRGGG